MSVVALVCGCFCACVCTVLSICTVSHMQYSVLHCASDCVCWSALYTLLMMCTGQGYKWPPPGNVHPPPHCPGPPELSRHFIVHVVVFDRQ